MVELSEFEKQRQQNISRNKELFKKLNLNSVSQDFHRDLSVHSPDETKKRPKSSKSTPTKKVKKETVVLPTRRSSRIAGVKIENSEGLIDDEWDKQNKQREKERLDSLKNIRLSGDLNLQDLLSKSVKTEGGDATEAIMNKLSKLGSSISMGDFYENIKDEPTTTKEVRQVREELENLTLYEKFHPNDIRLTTERMTSINFHPANNKQIIVGGDKTGELGIWSVADDGIGEPEISHFRYHGKHIPKIQIRIEEPSEILSCSYDGSIRLLDISKSVSRSVLEFDDAYGDPSAISDMNFIDKNICYFTTLSGEFGIIDIRTKSNARSTTLSPVLRLHDKKIGSFSINPNNNKQLATASLDRSLRIWDLRTTAKSTWSGYEDSTSPHCIGSYYSRLSISTADWNKSNDIVCNGYANTINVFQLSPSLSDCNPTYTITPELEDEIDEGVPVNLKPSSTLTHNCQTGRWVSILKARWQHSPVDKVEKFVIGNMKRYFDVFDRDGVMLAHLSDQRITSVPAVCCFHPTENWIVGGNASGKAMLFT